MTPEDIKKLPTPETDAMMNPRGGHDGDLVGKTRSLEQRLAAAVMAAEDALSGHTIYKEMARETVASIRSMK